MKQMKQWVINNLRPLIEDNNIIIKKYNNGVLEMISIDDFVSLFAGVQEPSYETLKSALPPESGWPATFDEWKAAGIFN